MLSHRSGFIALAVLGLTLTGLWTNIIGYSYLPGSGTALFDDRGLGISYALGTLACGLLFLLARGLRFSKSLLATIAVVGVLGTLLSVGRFPAGIETAALGAPLLIGFAHLWFSGYLYLLLARHLNVSTAVAAIAGALMLEIVFTPLASVEVYASVQVGLSLASPLAIAAVIGMLQGSSVQSGHRPDDSLHEKQKPSTESLPSSMVVTQIVVAAAAVVVMQSMTAPGLWGEGFGPDTAIPYDGPTMVLGLTLFAGAAFLLVRTAGIGDEAYRHITAFVILISGLFFIAISDSLGLGDSVLRQSVTIATEGFSHLLLWNLVIETLSDSRDSLFLVGVVGVSHAVLSGLWMVAIRPLGELGMTILLAALYTLFMLVSIMVRSRGSASVGLGTTDRDERIELLGSQHGLSSREQEVLALLLQGKSRTQIAEALFISENTVKTHTAHVYKKLGVASKSELFAKVSEPMSTK